MYGVIEKNIEPPGRSARKQIRETLEALGINDSVKIGPGFASQKQARSLISYLHRQSLEKCFTTKKVDGGIRVWRLS